jgi:ornithine cyclodeaminase/alanine dehydrogenase
MLRSGTHINGVGSHTPTTRELDSETIVRSRIVADSREAVFAEAGDVLIPIEEGRIRRHHVIAELGAVLNGTKPGRLSDEDITLFKSNGIAFQDVVTADIAYRRARENGFGQEFDFDA